MNGKETVHRSWTRVFSLAGEVLFCSLEAWYQARSTSWWMGKRIGLTESSREDGRRRACGMQSQKVHRKAKRDDRFTSLTRLTRCWNGSEGRRTWPPSSSLESHLSVYFVTKRP